MADSKLESHTDEGGGDSNCSTMPNKMPPHGDSGVANFSKKLNEMPPDGRRKVRASPLCAPAHSASSTSPVSPPCHPSCPPSDLSRAVMSPGLPSIAGPQSLRSAHQVWHVPSPTGVYEQHHQVGS